MDKWTEQAAPNNNQKAHDLALGRDVDVKGVSYEVIRDMKTENEIRKQNL